MYQNTELYREEQNGSFIQADELEKLLELKVFIENLTTETFVTAVHASNIITVSGDTPKDSPQMLAELQRAIDHYDAKAMQLLRSLKRQL